MVSDEEARRRRREYVERVVAKAPPLTKAQADRLAVIFASARRVARTAVNEAGQDRSSPTSPGGASDTRADGDHDSPGETGPGDRR